MRRPALAAAEERADSISGLGTLAKCRSFHELRGRFCECKREEFSELFLDLPEEPVLNFFTQPGPLACSPRAGVRRAHPPMDGPDPTGFLNS